MNHYSHLVGAVILIPPLELLGTDDEPPETGYLLLTDETPILLTDGEFLQLT